MTRYLVTDVMKRQNTGKKRGWERGEDCNFLGHEGARELGARLAARPELV